MSRDHNPMHGECLSENALTGYLEGTLEPAVKAASEGHLAACDDCRATLSLLMRLLNHGGLPVSPAEEAVLNAIGSSRPHKHAFVVPRSSRRSLLLPLTGIAASLLFGWFIWNTAGRHNVPDSPEAIVQLLMEQGRSFEPRLSGQPYQPLERTRAPRRSAAVDYDLVEHQMRTLGADPYHWGKLYLLRGEINRAISFLKDAAGDPAASASVYNDLGVAYLALGKDSDLSLAGQEFQRAIRKESGFETAVFNLALFYERSHDPLGAESEWRHYLRLDPTSGWAEEARSRLEMNH